jgi:FAD synthetase
MAQLHDHHDDGRSPAAAAANGYPAGPLPLRDVCLALRRKVDAFLAEQPEAQLLRDVQTQLRVSLEVIDEALQRYTPEQISISYNGGKDCLVLLIAVLASFARTLDADPRPAADTPDKLQAVYIVPPDAFPEVDAFVASSAAEYRLDVARYVLPMRRGLDVYLADRPKVRAIFVGTRRTDPHGENLKHFDPTDAGWPDFMRVHPVIDWHYTEIWAFIRHLGISYCPLYDLVRPSPRHRHQSPPTVWLTARRDTLVSEAQRTRTPTRN